MARRRVGRREFIRNLGAGLLAAGLPTGAFGLARRRAKRPNIVFFFSDDHAYQAISAYGGLLAEAAPTPHIDRLAAEGMRFTNCCVANSICAPSRATVLTGRHSHLNGVMTNRDRFDGSQPTFPKLLRESGYATAIIGKWHLKSDPTGFDHWDILPGQGNYYNPDFRTPEGSSRHEGYVTEIITEKATDWLKEVRGRNEPFLLMVHHKAPHRNWMPGPNELGDFSDTVFPEPPTLFDDYGGRGRAAREQEMTIARHMDLAYDLKVQDADSYKRLTEGQRRSWGQAYGKRNSEFERAGLAGADLFRWKYQEYMKDYLRCIRAVDESVGKILDSLDEYGLAEDTVVVYASDQGFYLGEHGWFDKRFMYEESFKTPLIVRWPGVAAPANVNADLVQNLDFAQTFLEIAGVKAPPTMQGRSLVALLRGNRPANWRGSLYYHYYEFPAVHSVRRHEGVYDGRFKLISFYDLKEWELYDLAADPSELRSIHEDPQAAAEVKRLRAEMTRLKALYGVKVPAS